MSSSATSFSESRNRTQLDGVLNQLAERIPGVAHAIAVSGDGLRLGATSSLGDERADQLAAIASGIVSLGVGAAKVLEAGGVVYHMLVMAEGVLVVQAVADGTSLAALARPDADTSMVAYELATLATRIGGAITPDRRTTD
jgi:predicted regulator of Ras-like GTPase activity (Roadblock/LC7/MglB family)